MISSDTKLSGLILLGAIFAFLFAFPVLGVALLVLALAVYIWEVNDEHQTRQTRSESGPFHDREYLPEYSRERSRYDGRAQ